jgi:hypothetical protein
MAGNYNVAAAQLSRTYDTIVPTASVVYSTTSLTNSAVVATLTGSSESITVTNNSGALTKSFTSNGSFTFNFIDAAGNTGSTIATVNNIDTTAPVITLVGSGTQTVAQSASGSYSDSGAIWTDNVDGSGTIAIASSGTVDLSHTGTYTLNYTYTDIASNTGNTVTRTVTVTDQTAPVITLIGASNITLAFGASYSDLGATWLDNIDGTGVLSTSGSVNTSTAGTYTLLFSKTDIAGNTGTTVRTVIVNPFVSTGGGGGG